ncbi:MAG: hypothetical protein RIS29_358 [Bacteroidota bacterium]|jgi:hypothetical protein
MEKMNLQRYENQNVQAMKLFRSILINIEIVVLK